jgi:hypothetical protein
MLEGFEGRKRKNYDCKRQSWPSGTYSIEMLNCAWCRGETHCFQIWHDIHGPFMGRSADLNAYTASPIRELRHLNVKHVANSFGSSEFHLLCVLLLAFLRLLYSFDGNDDVHGYIVPPTKSQDRDLNLYHNQLPFISSFIYYSLIIPLFNVIEYYLLTASWYKPQIKETHCVCAHVYMFRYMHVCMCDSILSRK